MSITTKDKLPKTRKSLFGNKTITKSRSTDEKGRVVKGKYVQKPDGSSMSKTVVKKPGIKNLFGKKETTTIYKGVDKGDVLTEKRTRKKGILPRTQTTSNDQLMNEKSRSSNLFSKIDSKLKRKK
mgnify:CR=1 FL=1|jgi:hypothetical protein